MTVQWSEAVRNAVVSGWESAIGTTPTIQLRTGAQPANTVAAASGTLLAEYDLASDWAGAPSGGAVAMSGLPVIAEAIADGTIGHYRIVDAAGTTCHEQGSVTATGGGGDLTVDNPVLATGQSVQITSWTKTAPGA